jgi:processive 1,2-diacylglycerol beta-glucosyltransferase
MRILILTSSTGGGHDMRANSLLLWSQRPEARHLNLQVEIRQALEDTHLLYKFGVELYNWIQRTFPALHHIYFNYLEIAGLFKSWDSIVGAQSFMRTVETLRPDVIVSVHGSLNHGFFDLAREALGKNKVCCVTYCGELHGGYGFSKHWVNPHADLFIGAVQETCAAARWLGMAREKTMNGGFLLHPDFYAPPFTDDRRRAYIRDELQLDPDKFILLLASGAQGANNHLAFLERLHKAGLDLQAVVLCGKSPQRIEKIEAWGKNHPRLPVRPLPHSRQMHQLLQVCDVIVARGGTGTVSESILCGCPLIINGMGGIMPQEQITTKFCQQNNLAQVAQTPGQLVRIVRDFIEHPEKKAEVKAAMAAVKPVRHPLDILKLLSQLVPAP